MTQTIPTLTTQEMINVILRRKGAQIVSFQSVTPLKLKKSNPFGDISKKSHVNGIINFIYENAVNKVREREGHEEPFVVAPRQWGEKIAGTPFVRHTKDDGLHFYLTIKVEKSVTPPTYTNAAGETITSDQLTPHMYASGNGSGRQEVEETIITRDYDLRNITTLTLGGVTYLIVHRGECNIEPR